MEENIKVITLQIKGMTCSNCENHMEEDLLKKEGVIHVSASYNKEMAKITYDMSRISVKDIIASIEESGYQVFDEIPKKNWSIFIILAGYLVIRQTGALTIFNMFPQANENTSYGMLFIIGLLTSVHCVAMCGGINLSQCMASCETEGKKESGKLGALRPSFLYNLGRVISYTVFGAVVGGIGSVISFTGRVQGIVQVLVGIFMVIMGLNMLNIFPALRKLNPRMPKRFAKKINAKKNSNSPFYVGLLNGLMPCGPLQAMQLYALSTGSLLKGAFSMFLFSLGTVPLLFGIGALSSIISKKSSGKIIRLGAVLVVVLGMSMFNNGLGLAGFAVSLDGNVESSAQAQIEDGVQVITTQITNGRYQPIVVEVGTPVRWNIEATASDINGCNNRMIIREYGIEKRLIEGDNIVEFTPTETGTFTYSCWMGMIRSTIYVVEPGEEMDLEQVENSYNELPLPDTFNQEYSIPTDKAAVAVMDGDMQKVKFSVKNGRFTPAVIVIEKGKETEITIEVEGLDESSEALSFPLYGQVVRTSEGENKVWIIPSEDFTVASIDYRYFAYVKVVDDIEDFNIDEVKDMVKEYQITDKDYVYSTGGASCH